MCRRSRRAPRLSARSARSSASSSRSKSSSGVQLVGHTTRGMRRGPRCRSCASRCHNSLADFERRFREETRRAIVKHGGVDLPLALQPVGQRLGDGQMAHRRAVPSDARCGPSARTARCCSPSRHREDRVRQVVPVDDEPRAAHARHQPRDGERRHRRRVLDQNDVGLWAAASASTAARLACIDARAADIQTNRVRPRECARRERADRQADGTAGAAPR